MVAIENDYVLGACDAARNSIYQFKVSMTCKSCSTAITALLKQVRGVEYVDCDLETELVTVKGSASLEDLKAAIEKSGKRIETSVELNH